jgi:hypothetical protein
MRPRTTAVNRHGSAADVRRMTVLAAALLVTTVMLISVGARAIDDIARLDARR